MTQVNETQVQDTNVILVDDVEYNVTQQEQYFREQTIDGVKKRRPNQKFESLVIVGSDNEETTDELLMQNLVTVVASIPKQVAAILNKAMLEETKAMFVANKDNWDYVPDYKLAGLKVIGDKLLEPVRKGRTITKVSLASLGNWYESYSINVLGKTEKAANNGNKIIADNFSQYLTEIDVLNMFISIFKDVNTDDKEVISPEDAVTLQAVVKQLDDVIEASKEVKLSVDSL